MSTIYGKNIGFEDAEKVAPPKPDESEYSWYKTETGSSVDTIYHYTPYDGWYRFYVIGDGGNGGPGSTAGNSSEGLDMSYGAGGGGGSTGGYAIHEVHLWENDEIAINRSSANISLVINENQDEIVYATHGGNGNYGSGCYSKPSGDCCHPRAGSPGTVGTANGGNVANYGGVSGVSGSINNSTGIRDCQSFQSSRSAGGVGGIFSSTLKYVGTTQAGSDTSATGSTSGSGTKLGAAGGGGSGGRPDYDKPGKAGGSGYTGGVVIEVVAD